MHKAPTKHPTMIGCPACAGCLSLEEGPHGHRQFLCSVGHAFSLWELYESKEAELERAQWSTIALYKHLEMILEMLQASGIGNLPDASVLRHRLAQIEKQVGAVQQVIQDTHLPALQAGNFVESGEGSKVR